MSSEVTRKVRPKRNPAFSTKNLNADVGNSVPVFALLAAICVVILLFRLGYPGLWDIDEGMHAAIAKSMVLSGDWVTPMFNGEPFYDKPAMFNWLVAASFSVFGFTDFAARLPAAVLGIGCVFLTYGIGRRFFGTAVGFLAGMILATSLEFMILSRMVIYDVPFAFFTTLSLYFLCDALFGSQRKTAFLAFHVSVAFAILTKGPLGFVIPWLAIGIYLLWQRDLGRLREFRLMSGALIIAVIVAPWYVLMELANPGYLQYFIVQQHFANALGSFGDMIARHPQPVYFYVPAILLGFFPWSFLLPGAMHNAWTRRGSRDDKPLVFLLIWFVAAFVLFSFARSKLVAYLLPLFPAAALLLGRFIADISDASRHGRTQLMAALGVPALIVLLLAVWVVTGDAPSQLREQTGFAWRDVEAIMVILTVAMVAAFSFAWRDAKTLAVAVTATATPLLLLLVYSMVAPDIHPFRSSVQMAAAYDRLLPPGEKMVFSDKVFDTAIYYTGRDAQVLHGRDELHDYLQHDGRVYVLARRDSGSLVDCTAGFAYVVYELGNKVILSNHANDPEGDDRPPLPAFDCLAYNK